MKDMKLAPLPESLFTAQDAYEMLYSSIFIINESCKDFLLAETEEEKKVTIANFIETHKMQSKVIELLSSECSVDYIAKGFMK